MDHATRLQEWLRAIGFDGDPEMDATGERFSTFLREWVPSAERPDISICAATAGNGPVAVREVAFHSLCAHHLLPFFGTCSVAYQPSGKLAGLGAIPRVVAHCARRPQLQERMTEAVADVLADALAPQGLLVVSRARHMCVEMRGAATQAEAVVVSSRGDPDAILFRLLGV